MPVASTSAQLFRWLSILMLLVALAGCTAIFAPERVAPAQLKPGDEAPVATEPAVIVGGAISNANDEHSLVLDVSTLERLGTVQYEVDDPWRQQPVVYGGVLLVDLLRFAGADDAATTVQVVAWDDYAVEIPIEELDRWSILLATRDQGATIPMDHGGPTRVILPYQHHPDITEARNMSVWNIRKIEVR